MADYMKKMKEHKTQIGTISIFVVLYLIIPMSWIKHSVYEATSPFGTLLTGVAFMIAFLCYTDLKKIFKDPVFYLMIVADVLALINLFLIQSNKGAFLTVVDVMLALYLADKLEVTNKQMIALCIVEFFFFWYWTFTPKGYYQGFNINYGGLVLLSGLMFGMIFLEWCKRKSYVDREKLKQRIFLVLQIVVMLVGYKIISYYLSRCALIGAAVFTVLLLIPRKFFRMKIGKVFVWLMSIGLTVGTIPFSLFLVWLGTMRDQIQVKILYKSVLSGREEVWEELWGVFMKQPLTGIGSSYKLHVVDLEGTFEVHSGLLDILFVHGVFVFVIVLIVLIPLLIKLLKALGTDPVGKCAAAAVFAMLTTSFFENYFIVPPFLILFLLLFAIVNLREKGMGSHCNVDKNQI